MLFNFISCTYWFFNKTSVYFLSLTISGRFFMKKWFLFAVIIVAFVLFANEALQINRTQEKAVKQEEFIMTDTAKVIERAKEYAEKARNAYLLSMPVLAAASVGDKALYEQYKGRFYDLIEESKNLEGEENSWMTSDDYVLWMKGRLLLAALAVEDTSMAVKVASDIDKALPDTSSVDSAMKCWALGYLQIYYAKTGHHQAFDAHMSKLKAAIKSRVDAYQRGTETLSNTMWSLAMAVGAVSVQHDTKAYYEFVAMLPESQSLSDYIGQVPDDDFPYWLTALFYNATPDKVQLRGVLNTAKKRTKSDQDKMMGDAELITFYQYKHKNLGDVTTSPGLSL